MDYTGIYFDLCEMIQLGLAKHQACPRPWIERHIHELKSFRDYCHEMMTAYKH